MTTYSTTNKSPRQEVLNFPVIFVFSFYHGHRIHMSVSLLALQGQKWVFLLVGCKSQCMTIWNRSENLRNWKCFLLLWMHMNKCKYVPYNCVCQCILKILTFNFGFFMFSHQGDLQWIQSIWHLTAAADVTYSVWANNLNNVLQI